ncbi:MAG: hypothetical protein HGA27_02350 [Peptococcaceae bacterium]|nr:hypothetical protein [Peptococcaceae bacterium]
MTLLMNIPPIIWAAVIVWSLTWKGIALWHAARCTQRGWYIALILINTLGILEIIYLVFFKRSRYFL